MKTSIQDRRGVRQALLWAPTAQGNVKCSLCAHRCLIRPGKRGICGVRENSGGELYTLVYGLATSLAVDPIEKKPLFHFKPGARTLSLATVGCNFGCLHCQNHSISQLSQQQRLAESLPGQVIWPKEVVAAAGETRSEVIAYTYTEPTIFMEYALEVARLAAEQRLFNVFVTNGYLTAEAEELIAPYLHAANIDLKGMDDRMLKREVKAVSGPVLRTIESLHRRGVWVEVTTLVIPGSNDDDPQLQQIADFIAGLSQDIPWHVSRFHPTYRLLDRPPTPVQTLRRAVQAGKRAGLRYVYTGNTPGDDDESTRCPSCGDLVIERRGFSVARLALKGGCCQRCGQPIAGRALP